MNGSEIMVLIPYEALRENSDVFFPVGSMCVASVCGSIICGSGRSILERGECSAIRGPITIMRAKDNIGPYGGP